MRIAPSFGPASFGKTRRRGWPKALAAEVAGQSARSGGGPVAIPPSERHRRSEFSLRPRAFLDYVWTCPSSRAGQSRHFSGKCNEAGRQPLRTLSKRYISTEVEPFLEMDGVAWGWPAHVAPGPAEFQLGRRDEDRPGSS